MHTPRTPFAAWRYARTGLLLPALAVSVALVGLPSVQATAAPGSDAAPSAVLAKKQPKKSIRVTISGLPSGVSAMVTVKGPKGFKKRTLKASALLKKLPTGTYKITAKPVTTTEGSATATVSKPKVKVKKSSRLKVAVKYTTPPKPAGKAIAEAIQGPGVTIKDPVYTGSALAQGAIAGVFTAPTRSAQVKATTPEAWLLSTGKVEDALKTPPMPGEDFFASTAFSLPGDQTLASLLPPDDEGNVPLTYDAAFVTFQVVPQGSTLNIRYRFASEEYPEYVDSKYNDVMGIFVNGKNCATVPGVDSGPERAVAVNSVNATTNPGLYVDNLMPPFNADTSYDGFTTPLTCSVPVTAGTPVDVKIGVADTSDEIWDTAVALLSQGVSSS